MSARNINFWICVVTFSAEVIIAKFLLWTFFTVTFPINASSLQVFTAEWLFGFCRILVLKTSYCSWQLCNYLKVILTNICFLLFPTCHGFFSEALCSFSLSSGFLLPPAKMLCFQEHLSVCTQDYSRRHEQIFRKCWGCYNNFFFWWWSGFFKKGFLSVCAQNTCMSDPCCGGGVRSPTVSN